MHNIGCVHSIIQYSRTSSHLRPYNILHLATSPPTTPPPRTSVTRSTASCGGRAIRAPVTWARACTTKRTSSQLRVQYNAPKAKFIAASLGQTTMNDTASGSGLIMEAMEAVSNGTKVGRQRSRERFYPLHFFVLTPPYDQCLKPSQPLLSAVPGLQGQRCDRVHPPVRKQPGLEQRPLRRRRPDLHEHRRGHRHGHGGPPEEVERECALQHWWDGGVIQ